MFQAQNIVYFQLWHLHTTKLLPVRRHTYQAPAGRIEVYAHALPAVRCPDLIVPVCQRDLTTTIDRSSPLLAKALCTNEVIEGTFKFFRPNPNGDGTTEHYFTVEIENGRVTRIHLVSPDGYANPGDPPFVAAFEDVQFIYNAITWRYEVTGAEHSDTLNLR